MSINPRRLWHRATKTTRNRKMMAAYESGTSIAILAAEHGLGEQRVKAILADERNRLDNSTDPFYARLRKKNSKAGKSASLRPPSDGIRDDANTQD